MRANNQSPPSGPLHGLTINSSLLRQHVSNNGLGHFVQQRRGIISEGGVIISATQWIGIAAATSAMTVGFTRIVTWTAMSLWRTARMKGFDVEGMSVQLHGPHPDRLALTLTECPNVRQNIRLRGYMYHIRDLIDRWAGSVDLGCRSNISRRMVDLQGGGFADGSCRRQV
jgi:hypothetical protein